ncbi:cytochrome P450 [Dictyobacter aurantiacus]|uniref:Putative cytochrome P450 YjiB n=1 Tax=Dictyobacter aurantiacus TaxID=1936993 RepID=A0A401ZS89_9CHLR|nr:cytochrome P450 [Dictyobacter aurantiacus]GCE09731.1 putative cytochrome P450 YjiB [Dictyobacter aurantiacus]
MQLPSFFNDFTLPPLEWHQQMREWSATMRVTEPVWFDEQNESWRIFRYADHIRVQNDYATFSSAPAPHENNEAANSIIAMDPPRHRQLRSLVTPAFSARSIAQLAPRIEEITQELLQPLLVQGQMDVVAQLAVPLPIIVIADMLGFPHENWPLIKQWTDALLSDSSLGQEESSQDLEMPLTQEQVMILYEKMAHTIDERRRHPRQDILSLLLTAEVDGEHLSDDDLYAFFITLLVAGNVTTTQLIGNAFLCFDQHPDAWQQLRQDPSLAPVAIEEILRCLPPNRGTGGARTIIGGRVATTDVQLGDQLIRKGQVVKVTTISANFDEAQFPDPLRFDIRRNPNRHLSFGHGIHFCLGAPLARLEAKIVLENLLRLLPEWRRYKDVPLRQVRSNIVFGVRNLPITF